MIIIKENQNDREKEIYMYLGILKVDTKEVNMKEKNKQQCL